MSGVKIMDAPFRLQQVGQDRVPPGPDHGGFGGSDGARAAEAQQGGAVSGEGVAGQAGRAPDPAFAEAAGADAAAAGGAGPPGPQRRHGAARRSGAAAGHGRPGGHGSAGRGRMPAVAADAFAPGGGVVGQGGRRGAARGVAAAGGMAAEGDGRVAAPEDAGHRHRQACRSRSTGSSRAARGTATITGACIIRSWRRRGRRATSWTCGCATGRCTRRTAAWSSCWRSWSGRGGICAATPPCASTRGIPESR